MLPTKGVLKETLNVQTEAFEQISLEAADSQVLKFVSRRNNSACAASETIRDTCSSSRDSWTLTAPSVLSGIRNPLRNLCRTLSGTVAMGLFPMAQPFFGGDSNVTMHRFRKT